MKMIILILKDNDADEVTQALTTDQYRVTRVASTGRPFTAPISEYLRNLINDNSHNYR